MTIDNETDESFNEITARLRTDLLYFSRSYNTIADSLPGVLPRIDLNPYQDADSDGHVIKALVEQIISRLYNAPRDIAISHPLPITESDILEATRRLLESIYAFAWNLNLPALDSDYYGSTYISGDIEASMNRTMTLRACEYIATIPPIALQPDSEMLLKSPRMRAYCRNMAAAVCVKDIVNSMDLMYGTVSISLLRRTQYM